MIALSKAAKSQAAFPAAQVGEYAGLVTKRPDLWVLVLSMFELVLRDDEFGPGIRKRGVL